MELVTSQSALHLFSVNFPLGGGGGGWGVGDIRQTSRD